MYTKPEKVPVSVLIPVRNEAANIAQALKGVCWADEVFVIDSHSIDGTQEIARSMGAHVVQFDFNGTWPKKRNWALRTIPFKYSWVLIIDADEVLEPAAEEEILSIVTNTLLSHSGYYINRKFYFLSSPLNYAYHPNWILRLVKHQKAEYTLCTGAQNNTGDNEVHEPFVVDGTCGRLKSRMLHYAFPTVFGFVEKHNVYSNWEAHVSYNLKHKKLDMSFLKKLRYYVPFRGLLRFLYIYLFQKGFMDGRKGYYFARLHGMYEVMSVIKEYELNFKEQKMKGLHLDTI